MTEIDLSLLSDFIVEAREHLEEMETELLNLEADPTNTDILNNIFRPIHTIKGASQFVGLAKVAALSHRMEDLLDLCRNGTRTVTPELIDILIHGRDRIISLVEELESNQSEDSEVDDLVSILTVFIEGEDSPSPASDTSAASEPASDTSAASEADASDTRQEGYAEPQDAELFEVFKSQLLEKIAILRTVAARVDAGEGDIFSYLGLASETINDLYNSANYMSYTELAELYSRWMESIDGVMRDLTMGKPANASFNDVYLDEIASRFPETQGVSLSEDELDSLLSAEESEEEHEGAASFGNLPDDLLQAAGMFSDEDLYAPTDAPSTEPSPDSSPEASTVDGAINAAAEADDEEEISDEIDMSLLNDFIIEAEEHLLEMENELLKLSENPQDGDVLDDIFRPIHTIKGASQFVGLKRVASLSHRLEDLLDLLRQGSITNTPEITDVLIQGRDRIVKLVEDLEHTQQEQTPVKQLINIVTGIIESGGVVTAEQETQTAGQSAVEETLEDIAATPDSEQNVPSQQAAPVVTSPTERPATTAQPVDSQAIVEDEYDSELFSIFINQLTEKVSTIRALISQLAGASEPAATLSTISEQITALRSAANYMGYEGPVAIYSDWHAAIERCQEELSHQHSSDFSFMQDYLERLAEYFPQIMDVQAASVVVERAPARSKPQPEKAAAPVQEEQPSTASVAASTAPDVGEDLYIRLHDALEGGVIPDVDEDYESLSEVFDEMLSSMPDVSFSTAPADHEPRRASKPNVSQKADELTKSIKSLSAESTAPMPTQAPASSAAPQTKPASEAGSVKAPAKPAVNQPQAAPAQTKSTGDEGKTAPAKRRAEGSDKLIKKSVRVDADKIDTLMNQVGELIVDRSYFFQLYNEMRGLQQHLKEELNLDQKEMKVMRAFTYRLGEAIASLSRTSNELQEGVMKVRMLPISQLFNRYPRLIHDLTHNTDKRVKLDIRGEETELDKMIVEELSDPLIHIIRNSVDHGIETLEERRSVGKPETATLILEAYQESNHIVIEVTDDGRGIDYQRIREKAVERGLVKSEDIDGMTHRELIRLIMAPGFSTAKTITKTSGRGVGMDVVKKNIEKLNGNIEIESKPGSMTQIRLKIPLTLAIIAALLVRVGRGSFTIPLSNVEETLRIYEADTSTIEGTEVIHLRGRTLPIFRLANIFNLDCDNSDVEEDKSFVVIVNTGSEQVGLVVDELMGQDEVVIKPLVDYLQERSGFSGATIIGDGRISLILDIYELVNMTANKQVKRLQELAHRQRYGRAMEQENGTGDDRPTVH